MRFKYGRRCRIRILYNHFYRFFICLRKQILSASILRELCFKNVDKQIIDHFDDHLFENDEDYVFNFDEGVV